MNNTDIQSTSRATTPVFLSSSPCGRSVIDLDSSSVDEEVDVVGSSLLDAGLIRQTSAERPAGDMLAAATSRPRREDAFVREAKRAWRKALLKHLSEANDDLDLDEVLNLAAAGTPEIGSLDSGRSGNDGNFDVEQD
ncbi:unnamed protein product, partial [Pylaiella littoralis]